MRRVNLTIEQSHRANSLLNRMRQTAGLVVAVICLSSGLALPTYCRTHHAPNQITTQPVTNLGWTITGGLNKNHYSHTATLLTNGKVLVAGGAVSSYAAYDGAELYDPVTGTWSDTGSLNTARASHTATLLQNGQVLVAGGAGDFSGFQILKSAELYDPATGQWRPTGSLNTIRRLTSATLLPNGKVLAVGAHKNTSAVDRAELYDPATGTWSSTGAPGTGAPRAGGSAVLLSNGMVLAVSGNSSELYDPDTERWSSAGTLNRVNYPATVTLLRNGKVLVTGWTGSAGDPVVAELYDSATGIWSRTGNLNAYPGGESYKATLLADGRVLVAGYSEELYDPDTGTWSFTGRLNAARDYHTATLLENRQVLVAGGVDGFYDFPIFLNGAELYDPATPPIAIPRIISASVAGKNLHIQGENFDPGAVILLNGEEQKTKNDGQNPATTLIGKKSGNTIRPGDKLQVRNPNGTISQEFTFPGV